MDMENVTDSFVVVEESEAVVDTTETCSEETVDVVKPIHIFDA